MLDLKTTRCNSARHEQVVKLLVLGRRHMISLDGRDIRHFVDLFDEIGHTQKKPTVLFCKNQASIILNREPHFRARTKHIQRKYHYVRDDLVAKEEAGIHYVRTDDMFADIFTKDLDHDKHRRFTKAMGLRLCSSGRVKTCA